MIIDILKNDGVTLRCDNCNTYFAWKPDEQSGCRLRANINNCEKTECEYYAPVEKKCPKCGNIYLTKIPVIVYKIMKEIRR